jgi:hypothetical protein
MKNIKDFILEGKDQWSGEKYIKKADLLKFCIKALKNSKTFASDIQDEISQYEDPDDLDRARNNDELTNYLKFENELANLLADDNKYSGLEGDICDNVFDNAYDIMEELYKMTSK